MVLERLTGLTINQDALTQKGFIPICILPPKSIGDLLSFFKDHPHTAGAGTFHSTMQEQDDEYKNLVDNKIRGVLQEHVDIILPGYEILFTNFVVKDPGAEGGVGIHTDWSYVDENLHASYNLWIPLTDVDERNGCLHVWPCSHTFTPTIRTTPYVRFNEEEEGFVRLNSIPIPLSAGQGVLYHSGLIHYSNPNRTNTSRPAIAMVLIPKGVQPMHYYQPDIAADFVEAHRVNPDFFLSHKPDNSPQGTDILKTERVPRFSLNAQHILSKDPSHSTVSTYYDEWTDAYRGIYGEVIQAFRPKDEEHLLNYIADSAGMSEGQYLVDAGCGVCGPAIFFAKNRSVKIEAMTLSDVQVATAKKQIAKAGLSHKVNCFQGDYRMMNSLVSQQADGVLFLESLGHSTHSQLAIQSAYDVLQDGGYVYIKDFFPRETANPDNQERILKTIDNINREYNYATLDLHQTISQLRKAGFIIDFIRSFRFESNTEIRETFELKHDISVFEGGEFMPAEWLEIRAVKYFSRDDR